MSAAERTLKESRISQQQDHKCVDTPLPPHRPQSSIIEQVKAEMSTVPFHHKSASHFAKALLQCWNKLKITQGDHSLGQTALLLLSSLSSFFLPSSQSLQLLFAWKDALGFSSSVLLFFPQWSVNYNILAGIFLLVTLKYYIYFLCKKQNKTILSVYYKEKNRCKTISAKKKN